MASTRVGLGAVSGAVPSTLQAASGPSQVFRSALSPQGPFPVAVGPGGYFSLGTRSRSAAYAGGMSMQRGLGSLPSLGSISSSLSGSKLPSVRLPQRRGRCKGSGEGAQASLVKPAIAVAGSVLVRIPPPILIPSCVAAIVYALMGLEGLVRWMRSRCKKLLNQPEEVPGEDNWSSSRVRKYVLPYIKPVVIWAAIFVMCGALDRLQAPYLLNKVKGKAVNVLRVFASVFSVTYCITVVIQHMQAVVYKPVGATEQVGKELVLQTIDAGIWFLGFALGMELLGVASNSFITAGGIGTLVFTFAGKEIVGNALSGMTIQATKPFTVGDWISIMVNGQFVEGHVENMGWWQLTLKTFERESSRIANQQVINSVITNVTAKTHWRFKSYIHLYLFTPEEQVQKIVMDIRKLLAEHNKIEHRTLHRRVFYDGHNISVPSKDILVSCYFQTRWMEEYSKLKEELMYNIEAIISRHGSRYATPIRTHDYTASRTPPSMSSPYDSPTQRLFLAEMTVYKNEADNSLKHNVVDVTPSAVNTVDVTPTSIVDLGAVGDVGGVSKRHADVSKGVQNGVDVSKEAIDISKNGAASKASVDVSSQDTVVRGDEVKNGAVGKEGADVTKKGADVSKKGAEVSKKGAEVSKKGAEVSKKGAEASKQGPDVNETGADISRKNVPAGHPGAGKGSGDRRNEYADRVTENVDKSTRVSEGGTLEQELAEIMRRTGSSSRSRGVPIADSAQRDTDHVAGSIVQSPGMQNPREDHSRVNQEPTLTHLQYKTPEEAAAAAAAFSAAAAEAAAAARALLSSMHTSGGNSASHSDPREESTSYGGHGRRPFVIPPDVDSSAGGKQAKKSPRMTPLGPRTSERPEASDSPKGAFEPLREAETMSEVPYRGIGETASPGRDWASQYFAGDRQVARGFASVSEYEHLQESDEEDLRVSEADYVEDLGPMSVEETEAWKQADAAVGTTSRKSQNENGENGRHSAPKSRGEEQQQSRTDGATGPPKEKLAGLETMGLSRSDITLLGIAIDKTGRQSAVLDSAFDPSISPTQLAQRSGGAPKGQGGTPQESGGGKKGGTGSEDGNQEQGGKEPAAVLVGKEGVVPAGGNVIPPVTEQLG